MQRKSLRLALMGGLLVMGACGTGSQGPDPRLGQSDEYWTEYQQIHPHSESGAGSWVGSNKGHR